MSNVKKFDGKSDLYAKYRPSYPAEFLDDLIKNANIPVDGQIADIGSGTGILTQLLLKRGYRVYGVEPNSDMRRQAEESLAGFRGFRSIAAAAEETSLPDHSVDLITAAQAFHWFDRQKFREECRRIIKPDGFVALVWNSRDSASEQVRETADVCREFCPGFQGFSGGMVDEDGDFFSFYRGGVYQRQCYRNDLVLDETGFLGRQLSASYAPQEKDPNYPGFVAAMRNIFQKYAVGGKLVMPNLVRSYIGQV